jgi:AcrR family transcriptional regulator
MQGFNISVTPSQGSYHHGDLSRALVQAAVAILEEEGIAALSLRAVARRAGVSHAAPYHHFPDKNALLAAVAGYGFQKMRDAMATSAQACANPLAGLQAFGMAYTGFARTYPALFRLMFTQETVLLAPGEPKPKDGVVDDLTIEGIRRATGCSRKQAKQINLLLWSSVHGLAMLWLDGQLGPRNAQELETKTRELTELLGHVLKAIRPN